MVSGTNKIKILIISTSNPNKTAGIVAKDIFRGFKENGFEVKLLVKVYDNYTDGINSIDSLLSHLINKGIYRIEKMLNRSLQRLNNLGRREYHVQDFDQCNLYYSTSRIMKRAKITPDVIFIIFAQNFINVRNIYELQKRTGAIIYWQLADMSGFTGLCHYSWSCLNYTNHCGSCPAIDSSQENDISRKNLLYKKKYLGQTDLRIFIGSDWLIERAKKSAVFKDKPISKVLLSVNEKLFYYKEGERKILREKYGIPHDSFILSFGAHFLDDKRKGIQYILSALNLLAEREKKINLFVIFSGNGYPDIDIKFPNLHFGLLERDQLPDFYRLSNLFVNFSLQEVGPYMIVESLMCGTPVISYVAGFSSEFIKDGYNGHIVHKCCEFTLSKTIEKVYTMVCNNDLAPGQAIHEEVFSKVSLSSQINEYTKYIKIDLDMKGSYVD